MDHWEQIVTDAAETVLRVATRILGNAADAEEVAQEAFCQAYEAQQHRRVKNWPGYLRTLATRRAIDRLRRRQSWQPLDDAAIGRDRRPDQDILDRELAERLRHALTRIPAQQATVFCLRFVEQQSNTEIAESLGISASGVSTALSKARTALRKLLPDVATTCERDNHD